MHHCPVWVCLLCVLAQPWTHKQCWFMTSSGFSLCMESAVTYGSWMSEFHVWLTQVCSSVTMVSTESSSVSDWLACRHWYIMQPAPSPNGDCAALELLLWAVRQESVLYLMVCVFLWWTVSVCPLNSVCTHREHCLLSLFKRMGTGQMGYMGAMHRKSRRQDPLLFSPAHCLSLSQRLSCHQTFSGILCSSIIFYPLLYYVIPYYPTPVL